MSPCSVIHIDNFLFDDGTFKNKFVICLNGGTQNNHIVAVITSQAKWYFRQPGCQLLHKLPFFLIPQGSETFLLKDSYVQLDEIRIYNRSELLQMCLSGSANLAGVLNPNLAKAVISCASNAEDISDEQAEVLLAVYNQI